MTRARPLALAFALLSPVAAVSPCAASPQSGDLRIEVGATRSFPPAGSDAQASSYLTAGLQVDRWSDGGSGVYAGAFAGFTSDATAGDWVSGLVGLRGVTGLGGPLEAQVDATGYGFRVGEPFVYETLAGEGALRLRLRAGAWRVGGYAEGGSGRSTLTLRRGERTRDFEADLWHGGGGPELQWTGTRASVKLDAGAFDSEGGTYRRVRAELTALLAGTTVRASAALWDTPTGNETTGTLTLSVPFGGRWIARLTGGRSEPDPLVRAQAGGQGGFALARQLVVFSEPAAMPLVRLEERDGTVVARFRLERAAGTVALLGDFTGWEERPMRRDGDAWVLELVIPAGTHHFGFMVDGAWYVPPGTPGAVEDEWGQTNATLVVP